MSQPKLSALRLAAFVAPEAPFSAFLMAVVVFVPPFFAGSVGLGMSAVGLIFGLTKLWDVVTDPAFGILSDKWHTRWGRRRPWLVASVPALGICTYMIFVPGTSGDGTYFAFWMIFLYIGWTVGTVSHIAWAAELSTDYHERSRISGYKQAAALVGTLGLVLFVAFSDAISGPDEAHRMLVIAVALIIFLPLSVLATLWSTPEPKRQLQTKRDDAPSTLRLLISSAPLRRLLAANLLLSIAASGSAGMVLFYVEDVLRLGGWSSFALVPFLFSGLLFLPMFVFLSKRIGKHRTLCYALIYQLVAGALYLVMPAESIGLTCLAFIVLGANQAVGVFIPRAMMADVADADTAESGLQKTGLYMSLLQSTSKIAAAFAVGLSYPILSLAGFDPSPEVVNSEEALFGLRMMMFLFPAIAFGLIILLMWNFPLSEERHSEIRRKIADRHASL